MRRLLRWANRRYGMECACVAVWCAALALAWPTSVRAQTPRAQSGASDLPVNPEKAPVTEPIFQFHSGFWLNLHHALYLQARLREGELISRNDNGAKPAAIPKDADANSAAWQAAVDYYVKNLAHRDLLFDGGMMLIKNRLAELETCPDLSGKTTPACSSGLQPGMIDALEGAAPVYRARWWPTDDQKNREWMAAVTPYIKQMGSSVAEQLAAIYHSSWPRDPIRVDVVAYAGPFGAYTTLDPVYVTVSSTDPRNQGLSAFEILFHEGSHALSTKVQDQIVEVCHERDIPIPRDLWHALLFYTTGEVVRRTLARGDGAVSASGGSGGGAGGGSASGAGTRATTYMPYAYRNGLYTLGWGTYQRALEVYWQPYLDGRDSFDHAIAQVVRAL